jgi:hypothetical protein
MAVKIATAGVSAVTPLGNSFGWVSGDIANLAASGSVDVIFDLGPDWRDVTLCTMTCTPVGPSTGFVGIQVSGSDTATYDATRRITGAFNTGMGSSYLTATTAAGSQQFIFRPFGRFVFYRCPNGDAGNAIGATAKISLTAF